MSLINNSYSEGRLPKIYFSEHNERIIKEINNKIGPLKMSPRVKNIIEKRNFFKRPTLDDYTYFKDKTWHSLEKDDLPQINPTPKIKHSRLTQSPSVKRYLRKSLTTADLRARDQQQGSSKEIEQIKKLRLPLIKQEISRKKQELAKSIQYDSMVFQKDTFNGNQGKIYTLEYVLNRLDANDERKKNRLTTKLDEPIKGYENLSPNMLKQYIQCFKRKKTPTQSLHLSRKRITRNKDQNAIQLSQSIKRTLGKQINLNSQNIVDEKSKRGIFITEENLDFETNITEKQIQHEESIKSIKNQDQN